MTAAPLCMLLALWALPPSLSRLRFRLAVPPSNVFHGNSGVAHLRPYPNDDPSGIPVDFPHHPHLGGLLLEIRLVDADSVDPEHARLVLTSQVPQRDVEVNGRGERVAGEIDVAAM